MTYEEAYFFKILLTCGVSDGYDAWLNSYLEREDPISDIVLELSLCGSDTNRAVTCLNDYCLGHSVEEKRVCDMLREYLLDAYLKKRFSQKEIIHLMYRFAVVHSDPVNDHGEPWSDMYYMDDYRLLAEDGVISKERFDTAFYAYLQYGIPVDSEALWGKKEGFAERIKKIFRK